MPSQRFDPPIVDNQLPLRHAHRENFTHALPGRRVAVVLVLDESLRVDNAINNAGRVVIVRGKSQ